MEVFNEILGILLKVSIFPAIIVLVKYAAGVFKEWSYSKAIESGNEVVAEYITEITDIIYQAVICTTQTYVESLKAQGRFDAEAQKIAFETTKSTVLALLAEDAMDFLANMYGDADLWLETKIEQMVNETKSTPSQSEDLIAEA